MSARANLVSARRVTSESKRRAELGLEVFTGVRFRVGVQIYEQATRWLCAIERKKMLAIAKKRDAAVGNLLRGFLPRSLAELFIQ